MIAGIVLAAGRSERFGSKKLLEPLDGVPIVCHSVRTCLSTTAHTWIVIAEGDTVLGNAIATHFVNEGRLSVVVNPDPARGQMSSLKAGLAALENRFEGAMVALGDMPRITPAITAALTAMFERTGHLVVPVCGGEWRHPRIIPRALFPEFLSLGDDERGTVVFRRHAGALALVSVGSERDYIDIDRRGDLDRATNGD